MKARTVHVAAQMACGLKMMLIHVKMQTVHVAPLVPCGCRVVGGGGLLIALMVWVIALLVGVGV